MMGSFAAWERQAPELVRVPNTCEETARATGWRVNRMPRPIRPRPSETRRQFAGRAYIDRQAIHERSMDIREIGACRHFDTAVID